MKVRPVGTASVSFFVRVTHSRHKLLTRRLFLLQGAQRAEQLTVSVRRFLPGGLEQRIAPQLAQTGQIGARMLAGNLAEHGFIGHQAGAQLLQPMQPGVGRRRDALSFIECRTDRLRIDIAHQAADVLHLPSLGFMLGHALRRKHGIAQIFRQGQLTQSLSRERDQFGAQILQCQHRPLLARLARRPAGISVFGRQSIQGIHGYDYRLPAPNLCPPMTDFAYTAETLRQIAENVLSIARELGATACQTDVSEAWGMSVSVRRNEVETLEHNRDKGLGVTVYLGQRRGHASSSDFSPAALRSSVEAALSIARQTAEDEAAGLAEAELLYHGQHDLDLYHPWNLSVEQAIDLARRCEQAALAVDPRLTNSEGATVSIQHAQFIAANSAGFIGGYPSSRHTLSCVPIASQGEEMQRDHWYTSQRAAEDLPAPEKIGQIAARRTLDRLGARKLKTRQCPVLFEAPLAIALLGNFVHAASGGALYRKASFLQDSLGKAIFPPFIQIHENPFVPRGLASSPFDDDGVATRARDVVRDGLLQGWFLSCYTARKLGLQTTGNAGGSHNLSIAPGPDDLPALLKKMHRGLMVTELLGQGVNYVTGDYSRGAAGYWIENGQIAYPVHEITIAGNLKEMFRSIVAVGNDQLIRGGKKSGSILIERMTVAGN